MTVVDLHKTRFRRGWFHLLKFTDEVLEKPELMEEMKKFSSESDIQPDEWTEPVLTFTKHKASVIKVAAAPKRKPMLAIGVEDDSKMRPNPHANFPPP